MPRGPTQPWGTRTLGRATSWSAGASAAQSTPVRLAMSVLRHDELRRSHTLHACRRQPFYKAPPPPPHVALRATRLWSTAPKISEVTVAGGASAEVLKAF